MSLAPLRDKSSVLWSLGPPLFLSTLLGIHSPVTSRSGEVLESMLCAASHPGVPILGFTKGPWGLDAISEVLGR